jgi:rhodanese-related sulfurtransferase
MSLKTSSAQLVEQAKTRIKEISAVSTVNLVDHEDIVFVDIRDIRERQREGYIPGSIHAPRGMIEFWVDPDSPYFKAVFGQDKRFIFHCASGWRSALTVATLQDMGFHAEHIEDGFKGWIKAGGTVEKSSN